MQPVVAPRVIDTERYALAAAATFRGRPRGSRNSAGRTPSARMATPDMQPAAVCRQEAPGCLFKKYISISVP